MKVFSTSGMFFHSYDLLEQHTQKGIVEIGGLSLFPILLVALCISMGLPKWFGYDLLSRVRIEISSFRICFLRKGIAPWCVPLVISALFIIPVSFIIYWVINGWNLTILAIFDIILWCMLQFCIAYGIKKREERNNHQLWSMAYGRDSWEANVPF